MNLTNFQQEMYVPRVPYSKMIYAFWKIMLNLCKWPSYAKLSINHRTQVHYKIIISGILDNL